MAEAFVAAEFRIQAVVADNVIAVLASGAGFENGRTIQIADAQLFEVGKNLFGVGKCELGVHLHAIGR